MTDFEKQRLIREAVDLPRLSMDDLSRITGLSVGALRKYRNGERLPTTEAAHALADGIQNQARSLEHIAIELRRQFAEDPA
ncbi:MAG: hypothetical protein AMJ65_06810 [Phycisphaerae bacterium SG8_4]|nr:MAG: hypothetical protein AMJ65_06810 [Phycisphaerae bacterium SG8_4]